METKSSRTFLPHPRIAITLVIPLCAKPSSLPAQEPIATCSEPHRYLLTTFSSPFTLLTRYETRSLSHCDVKTKPIRKMIPLTKPPVVKARPGRLTCFCLLGRF